MRNSYARTFSILFCVLAFYEAILACQVVFNIDTECQNLACRLASVYPAGMGITSFINLLTNGSKMIFAN